MFLAGDIGGTKTHLALYEKLEKKPIKEETYPSKEFKSLEEVVVNFLSDETVNKACFGIAGPVQNGVCKTTNLPWSIESKNLEKALKIEKVKLLNDLEANAWGIRVLTPEDFLVINSGQEVKNNNKALISAGTGLGEAGLFFDGRSYVPFACEGGHCDFSPRSEEDLLLWKELTKHFGHVSFERVLSGPGFLNIYRFVAKQNGKVLKEDLLQDVREITKRALNKDCPICEKTLDWFVGLYGSEAGNLALKFLSLSGVYIGGGIAPKIQEKLKDGDFFENFKKKGRFESLLEKIPVKVILNPNTALFGAAYYAEMEL